MGDSSQLGQMLAALYGDDAQRLAAFDLRGLLVPDFALRIADLEAQLAALETPEARRLAARRLTEMRLVQALVEQPPTITAYAGKYIILEGISGSGKDTQADVLAQHLAERRPLIVREATPRYGKAAALWDDPDLFVQAHLLLADRYAQIEARIRPALAQGAAVISIRSYLSTLVYQGGLTGQTALFDFYHRFVPPPDLVIILDLPAEQARQRIEHRSAAQGRPIIGFESLENLIHMRQRYAQLARDRAALNYVVVDAAQPAQQVTAEIQRHVDALYG